MTIVNLGKYKRNNKIDDATNNEVCRIVLIRWRSRKAILQMKYYVLSWTDRYLGRNRYFWLSRRRKHFCTRLSMCMTSYELHRFARVGFAVNFLTDFRSIHNRIIETKQKETKPKEPWSKGGNTLLGKQKSLLVLFEFWKSWWSRV